MIEEAHNDGEVILQAGRQRIQTNIRRAQHNYGGHHFTLDRVGVKELEHFYNRELMRGPQQGHVHVSAAHLGEHLRLPTHFRADMLARILAPVCSDYTLGENSMHQQENAPKTLRDDDTLTLDMLALRTLFAEQERHVPQGNYGIVLTQEGAQRLRRHYAAFVAPHPEKPGVLSENPTPSESTTNTSITPLQFIRAQAEEVANLLGVPELRGVDLLRLLAPLGRSYVIEDGQHHHVELDRYALAAVEPGPTSARPVTPQSSSARRPSFGGQTHLR